MVLTFFFFSFSIVAVGMIAKTARDAYFLSRFEKSILPLMFLAVAVIIAPTLTYYTKLTNKFSPRKLFIIMSSIFTISFILIQPFISGFIIPVVYIWVEIVVAISLMQFWGFASSSFEPQQAKRLFGIIGGGGSFAVMLIGMNLKPFVNVFGTDELLFVAAGFLVIASIFGIQSIQYFNKIPAKKGAAKKVSKKKKRKKDPFIIGIGTIVALSAIVTMLVDYQFKMIASSAFPNEADLVAFFGSFYSIAGAASIIMQFFITGPLLSRFGILIGLLILPFFLIAGSATLLFAPVLISASFAKFSDQTFKFTINNSSLELLWLPVPPNIRKYIKPQIGGTVKAIAEGLSGLLVFFLVKIIELQFLSVIALGAIVAWLFTSIRVKANYVKQLETAISKRQIDFEDLNVDVQDAAMVKTIEQTLSSEDEIQQLFALEIIEGLPLSSWKDSLERLFKEGSVDVRKRILSMAWDEEFILSNEDIISTMKKDDDVAIEAIMVAGRRKLTEILPDLEPLLSADSLPTRAAAAAAILLLEADHTDKAEAVLIKMLDDDDESTQATALNRLVYNNSILPQEKLIEFLKNEGSVISNVSLTIAEKRENPELIPGIISNLDIPKARAQARRTLNKFSDDLVIEEFEKLLSSSDLSRKLRLGIIRALREYPNDKPIDMLLGQLDKDDQDVYNEAVDSLLAIARLHPFGEEKKTKITKEIRMVATRLYALNEAIKLIPDDDNKFLMYDYLNNEIQNTLPTLLKLGVIDIPDTPIETYIHTVKSGDPAKLPFLLEFFENIFSKEERDIINPLIEPISLSERSKIGHSHFKGLPNNLDTVITESVYSPNKWESVIALDYLIKTEKMNVFIELDWSNVPVTDANKELLTRTIEINGTNLEFIPIDSFKLEDTELSMYSTLEKTIILKSVDLFKTIPAENLSRISQITEEVQFEANTQIFAEGDYGDSLFIVVNGNVKIHKGDLELVTLGKGSCLGEMALLDDEPRSADATVTEEDSILFKIEQEGFYEVMGSQSDIMEGIIKLLTGRLRDANEKLTAK